MPDMRLIDANALLVEVAHRNALDVIPGADFERIWLYSTVQLDMFNIVKTAPTIDAVPVVHARWVPNHGSYGTPHCSRCKWRIPYSEDSTLDAISFCPNCGAMMDGGASDG